MDLTKEQYTKEEVQEILNGVNAQVTTLTADLATAHEQAKELDNLKKDNLNNSIKLEMAKAGLSEDLFDLVQSENIDLATVKINKLKEIQKENIIDNSYKPEGHKGGADSYSVAEKDGNVEGMLKSKLSKIFG
ncbi:hypothetical protein [Clostridium ganghwense]|uniref:Scaffolding protein n=1 Tax=Clostridium ganghwense TaxID=312089 RepID=A0ABT4CUM9_9CLOT|nr:hypothetical protein [Clostridium ganghwense]MCY6372762.1 hypothetical protein [Clostridium ganghwense]